MLDNWVVNLSAVLFSIMLVVLASGKDCDDAISYWNELGNNLHNQGNYTGANICYDKAIKLANLNQPNAPILNEVAIQCMYHMNAIDKNNHTHMFSKIYAEPICIDEGQRNSDGFTLSFDATNPNCMDMRIVNISVNVIGYNSTWNSRILENFGTKPIAKYLCNIEPEIGSYKCISTFSNDEFIDLAPGELDHFAINLNADKPGLYEIRISLNYAMGSEKNRINVGDMPEMIGFFDKGIA